MTAQVLGMDTTAGLAVGEVLARGAQEIVTLAGRLEGSLHDFDWAGPDAVRVRESWSTTERPRLDAAAQFVGALAALLRDEARAQDEASGDAVAGAGAAPAALSTDPNAQRVQALTDQARRAGLRGDALQRYHDRLAAMTPAQVVALDPHGFHGTQPDGTTCGSSSLVMSRMINNPAYAMKVLDGYDPVTGRTTGGTAQDRFGAESLEMHHRTNGWHDRDGNLTLPWPEGAGTYPTDVAREMSAAGGSGVPGTTYEAYLVGVLGKGDVYDRMVSAAQAGHTVPVYVGDWSHPGHVVLATGTDAAGGVRLFEPSSGNTVTVTRDQWVHNRVDVAGWQRPWAVVVPER